MAPAVSTDKRIRGRKLQAIRKRHFDRQPLCVKCLQLGRVRIATELDHITPLSKGGSDDGPRQGLCKACHAEKTAKENGYRVRTAIGVDGYPVGGR